MNHYTDLLVPVKLQFFIFVVTIFEPYLSIFRTDALMIPFMFTKLENIYIKLLRLAFRQSRLKKTTSVVNRLKKDWIKNKENHLENDLMDIVTAPKLKLLKNKCQVRIKKEIPRRV